jgi:5-methylthioadenosine/S-adenosylhomocysteine deaminase
MSEMPMRTLIRDALIVSPGDEKPFQGWVEIAGGVIADVGTGRAPTGAGETIDGSNCALLPGLVNTHAHSHSSLTRGSAEGVALDQWLGIIEREQSRLTAEQARAGALATYAEALLSGTTTMVDMCLQPEAAFTAARDIGIRAIIAPYVADTKSFTPTLSDTAALLDKAVKLDDRVRVWVGLHDLESCSDDQIVAGVALARRHGAGVHLHCSETHFQIERTRKRTGRTPVAQLAHLGALGPMTLLAHCVWADEADREILKANGVSVAHCPHANLKLGSGIAPIADMLRLDINVTAATDGAKANNRLDLFDVMKFASLLQKGALRDPAVLPPRQVLDMATAGGGRALHAPIGAIKTGMAADLILVRLDRLHLQPCVPDTVMTNLVHAARGSDVSLTMVAGKVLVRDGELVALPYEPIRRDALAVGKALIDEVLIDSAV